MRELIDHKTNDMNDNLKVVAADEIGPGGAHHVYVVTGFGATKPDQGPVWPSEMRINFQKGGASEAGINGLTQEVLLAIVIDRLRSFQNGPFACRENALALTKLEEGLHWMASRTKDRVHRGVEGKSAA